MKGLPTDPLCAERCVYGTCRKTMADPYGCGGCCACLGGCQIAHERESAAIDAGIEDYKDDAERGQ